MTEVKTETVGCHWGHYEVSTRNGDIVAVNPPASDSHPSSIGESLLDAQDRNCRVSEPMVRISYLRGDSDHRDRRGLDGFTPVSWECALNLASKALAETIQTCGNEAIFGGSYGWSSAGRFHHAQSQLHRFLNSLGGYTGSVNTYSAAAAEVIVPHVLGFNLLQDGEIADYKDIAQHTDLVLAFGGFCQHNNQVVPGGVGNHLDQQAMAGLGERGVELINISPMRDDMPDFIDAAWIQVRPSSDVAMMLALAYHLETSGSVDHTFVAQYTTGYEQFREYLLGRSDGCPKDIYWAAPICGVAPEILQDLAHKLARSRRSMLTVSLSLQRQQHGEQAIWMLIVLAAMVGHIGLPGGGFALGWGSNGRGIYGRKEPPFSWGSLDQGDNPTKSYIPVARITDMLLRPGETYSYNGQSRIYPKIQLIYWAGGNPYHHHQDLNKLREAWRQPETVIVNESAWTATARHADIIFPATTFLERNDIVCGKDCFVLPSKKAQLPYATSRSDYEIFSALAAQLGVGDAFTQNRSEMEWLEHIYTISRANAEEEGIQLPSFEAFWRGGALNLELQIEPREFLIEQFRRSPNQHPLKTPSGRIEVFSQTIADFGQLDCPGHPVWMEKDDYLGAPLAREYPLHLISAQPKNKLHSQFDFGRNSLRDKVDGREVIRINPRDADSRGLHERQLVRVFNQRGACLAAVAITEEVMPGVVCLRTGAWFDPDDELGLERHGNPNVLTPDRGTSSLAQGPIAHSCLVEVELYKEVAPAVMSHSLPKIIES